MFGDMWSPEIVGRLADAWHDDLRKAVLVLPVVLVVSGGLWLVLALRTRQQVNREAALVPGH
jgi:hypothetical protein